MSRLKVERLTIVGHEHRQANDIAWPGQSVANSSSNSPYCDDIARRLRHLLAVHLQDAVVHPVPSPVAAPGKAHTLARFRSRGAERSGRCRRRGCRTSRRDSATTSPCTRCASRAGRAPHGLSQPGRSPADGFHSTKSPGSRLYGRHVDARAGEHARPRRFRQLPYALRSTETARDLPPHRHGRRRSAARSSSIICAMCWVARGSIVRRQHAECRHVGVKATP